jgi:membrane protein involved in colicin uptake
MTRLGKPLTYFIAISLVVGSASLPVRAQQDPNSGKDFDPVTRALSNKNPSIPDPSQAQAPAQPAPLTPEQQAELDQQKQLADIAAKKQAAKEKAATAEKARKEKEAAAKAAEEQKKASLKAAREARLAQFKQNREELAALLKEQRDAQKAYQEARKNATGDAVTQLEADYRKAEKDREAKIRELRHPKFKPLNDYLGNKTGNSTGNSTINTALPGTVTSGSGPTVTQH